MKKNKYVPIIVAVIAILAVCLVALIVMSFTDHDPHTTYATEGTENTYGMIHETYKEYVMPDAEGEKLDMEQLDTTLVEFGWLSDNDALQNAMLADQVMQDSEKDGYYFIAEVKCTSENEYNAVLPWAMFAGKDIGNANSVMLYTANADLTEFAPLSFDSFQPGGYCVLVGFISHEKVDDAQIHLYNSDYTLSVLYMDGKSEAILPAGYELAKD